MSTHKNIDRICVLAVALALLISVLIMNSEALGIQAAARVMGYEDKLFDNSRVHSLDIRIDDWDAFLSTAQSEEYTVCDVVIDGEAINNVGIRGKGNTSLSTVSSLGSQRYSFKIEFDQYDSTQSYHGLDKLSLNNMIQDNTMMKDYLTYTMMAEFGVAAPLCSFVYITVNGEDWGLYLAVEAVEDSFLQRSYGSNYGELYKPDSIGMGGGRGNGKEFDFENAMGGEANTPAAGNTPPEGFDPTQMGGSSGGEGSGGGEAGANPGNTDPTNPGGFNPNQTDRPGDPGQMPGMNGSGGGEPSAAPGNSGPGDMGGGMGSSDVKLRYIDDDPASYATIFDNAKTNVTEADQTRLIAALKALSTGDATVVDADAVMRYFVVHNYVVNADSYTGSMVHNYYLYEEDGQLAMIPWDYNLAYGTFHELNTDAVNDDIDAPLSTGGGDRPMFEWITGSEKYTEAYHGMFREFLDTVDPVRIIENAYALIAPYVERDPTKFCTTEEFEKAIHVMEAFCKLRTQSVRNQLEGNDTPVSADGLEISAMGTMNVGGQQMPQGGGFPGADQNSQGGEAPQGGSQAGENTQPPQQGGQIPGGMTPPQQGDQQGWPQDSGSESTEPTGTTEPTSNPFEGMQFPGGGQEQFPHMEQNDQNTSQNNTQWILLATSVVVMLLGLLFAFLFKR